LSILESILEDVEVMSQRNVELTLNCYQSDFSMKGERTEKGVP